MKQDFEDSALAKAFGRLGSNDNRLRIGERVEWMVYHFDRKYLHQRLLLAIINFPSLSDKDSYQHLH